MQKELKVQIPAPNIQMMKVRIKGTAPLIFHKWTEKAKKQILDKQLKKAQRGHDIRKPEEEYVDSFYYDSEDRVAFPALSIKLAMVNAVRNVEGTTMTLIKGAVFVVGDKDGFIPVLNGGKEITRKEVIKNKDKWLREDMVRIGMGSADLRFRGQLTEWEMEFIMKFNGDILSPEQVMNLLQIAGFACGLGEWRTERNGNFGSFEIATK